MADTVASDRALKLVSWNVNGLRAVMRKDPSFLQIFSQLDADVFAIQETKLQEGQVELDLPGYFQTWNFAERKGYSGTAVFSREDPLRVIRQIGSDVADDEGRVCALEFPTFWFVDVYTPNSKQGLARIEERMGWDERFRLFLLELDAHKPIVTCGDFNVAHQEIDLRNPSTNHENPGFSDAERDSFGRLLDAGDPGHASRLRMRGGVPALRPVTEMRQWERALVKSGRDPPLELPGRSLPARVGDSLSAPR